MSEPFRYRPRGAFDNRVIPKLCAASVADRYGIHQCQRNHRPDSEWCAQHSPEAKAERDRKSMERYEAKNSKLLAGITDHAAALAQRKEQQ